MSKTNLIIINIVYKELIFIIFVYKNTLCTTKMCVFKFHFCANRLRHIIHWYLRGTPHSWVKCRLSNCFRYRPLYFRPQLFGQTAGSSLQMSSIWYHSMAVKIKTSNLLNIIYWNKQVGTYLLKHINIFFNADMSLIKHSDKS